MSKKNRIQEEVLDEAAELKSRLEETEETLRAIQEYMVDAFRWFSKGASFHL